MEINSVRRKKMGKEPKYKFSKREIKMRKNIPYQLWRAIVLGLHFWKLVRKVH